MVETAVTLTRTGKSFSVRPDETLLDAAIRQGLQLPSACRTGSCGACKTTLLSGVARHDARAKALTRQDAERNQILTCCAYAERGPLELDLAQLDCFLGEHQIAIPARVAGLNRVAPDVMVVQVSLPKRRPMPYKAGQFLLIEFDDGRSRAFSFGSSDRGDGQIELHIGRIPGGAFTAHVFDSLKVGDVLRITGPHGDVNLVAEDEPPLIFVAGGTGMAPVLAMLEELVPLRRSIGAVYWGCRTADGFYADERLSSLACEGRFPVVRVVSGDIAVGGWGGRTGFVHRAIAEDYETLANVDVYACGNPAMVDAVRSTVHALGVSDARFFSDSFHITTPVLV